MILSVPTLLPQVYGFYSLVLAFSSLTFTLISNFASCFVGFTFPSSRPIEKLKKGVGQYKPPITKKSKLVVVKNTSSKPKRRSHRIALKLEFSNTQDDPIEIEEAGEEVSMQREEIVFTKDESKKHGSSTAFEGGHSSNDLSKSKDGHFQLVRALLGKLLWPFYLMFLR